jgi:hypothetical protein
MNSSSKIVHGLVLYVCFCKDVEKIFKISGFFGFSTKNTSAAGVFITPLVVLIHKKKFQSNKNDNGIAVILKLALASLVFSKK